MKCCLQQILKYLDLIVNSAHVKLFPYWCKKKHVSLSQHKTKKQQRVRSLQTEGCTCWFAYRAGRWDAITSAHLIRMWRLIVTAGVGWHTWSCPLGMGSPKMHIWTASESQRHADLNSLPTTPYTYPRGSQCWPGMFALPLTRQDIMLSTCERK